MTALYLNIFEDRRGDRPPEVRVHRTLHGARSFCHAAPRGMTYSRTLVDEPGVAPRVINFDFDDDPLPPADRARHPEPLAA